MPSDVTSSVINVFQHCVAAVRANVLIARPSKQDKEFHFQNWFKSRLDELHIDYDEPGRNTYPDFRLVHTAVGFELKGLAYPGRDKNYDSNSQIPRGRHHGRAVYYVFGRYPKKPDGNTYPVLDLVVCHGSFLNADDDYEHKNKSIKVFGTYGDIMIRDRKMYVVPTPYALASGLAHHLTLITPDTEEPDSLVCVGDLVRVEWEKRLVGYSFDLATNALVPELTDNLNAGRKHRFRAWRLPDQPGEQVFMFDAAKRR